MWHAYWLLCENCRRTFFPTSRKTRLHTRAPPPPLPAPMLTTTQCWLLKDRNRTLFGDGGGGGGGGWRFVMRQTVNRERDYCTNKTYYTGIRRRLQMTVSYHCDMHSDFYVKNVPARFFSTRREIAGMFRQDPQSEKAISIYSYIPYTPYTHSQFKVFVIKLFTIYGFSTSSIMVGEVASLDHEVLYNYNRECTDTLCDKNNTWLEKSPPNGPWSPLQLNQYHVWHNIT